MKRVFCTICNEPVPINEKRDHLAAHNPSAYNLEPEDVDKFFEGEANAYTVAMIFTAEVVATDETEVQEKAEDEFARAERHVSVFDLLDTGISEFGERELENELTRAIHQIAAVMDALGFKLENEMYMQGEQTLNYAREADGKTIRVHINIAEEPE